MMIPRVVAVEAIGNYVLHVRFTDGTEGDIDLSAELDGQVFLPLLDKKFFRQARVDSELHTVVWPNGADFAPEFLYDRIRIIA